MSIIVIIIFAVILLFFLMPASAIVYHLLKYGIKKDFSKLMAIVFSLVSLSLIAIAIFFLLATDWEEIFQFLSIEFQNLL